MPYKDKQKQREYHKLWHAKNRIHTLAKQKEYQLKIKLKVFKAYSGNIVQCECCSEQEIKFLSIDHIQGGGTKHKAEIGSHKIYFWLINNNFPKGYRVLCHNCNQAIGFFGECPHLLLKSRD